MDESWNSGHPSRHMSAPELQRSILGRRPLSGNTSQSAIPEKQQHHQCSAQEVFEYKMNMEVPELQGSAPTNFFAPRSTGPVDSYGLYGSTPVPRQPNSTFYHGQRPTEAFEELIGDTYHPVELPAHNSIPEQQILIPEFHVESYRSSWSQHALHSSVAELPAEPDMSIQPISSRPPGAHSDQEVASYMTRRMPSQRAARSLLWGLD